MKMYSSVTFARVSTFVSIIVIFIYKVVIDRDYKCDCDGSGHHSLWYMVVPSIVLFVFQFWTIKCSYKGKACRCNRKGCDDNLKYISYQFIKAVVVGLLWVISLLIDGEWAVCYYHKDIACKDKATFNFTEQETFSNVKSTSENVGWSLILVILGMVSGMRVWSWCRDPNYSKLYKKLKMKQEERVLKQIAKEDLKEELTLDWVEERSDVLVKAADNAVDRAARRATDARTAAADAADAAAAGPAVRVAARGDIDKQIAFLSGNKVTTFLERLNEGPSADPQGGGGHSNPGTSAGPGVEIPLLARTGNQTQD
ncbi:uncharacterized protein LOC114558467 isoform X2 [Perca flavescens]|uniref:uncharacterized protein LOC114558467 isoform X2 n=1 Tax=Perca flavescens TaxID=8167 RepID=UPI00106E873C|nr:uncharacterized protein LOC114558467 isoform X2 [Perca flavescens]